MIFISNCLWYTKIYIINSFLASVDFSCLLITVANSLEPDQDRRRSLSKLFDTLIVFLKEILNKLTLEKSWHTTMKARIFTQHAKI